MKKEMIKFVRELNRHCARVEHCLSSGQDVPTLDTTNLADEKLEILERKKYDYLVKKEDYGIDYKRESQIERVGSGLEKVSEEYMRILSSNSEVAALDIGSGPGGVMKWLLDNGVDAYGIDISKSFVKQSKKNFPELEKRVFFGNARNMNMFNDNSFELVQHLDGMEHIPERWEQDCLKEAVRVSKKYIVYETACADASMDYHSVRKGFGPVHINIKTPKEWIGFYNSNTERYGYKITTTCELEESIGIILEKI